jgi:hypothetical protein
VHVVEIVEMDDEDVPDDVLEETNAARYQMLPKNQKELEKFKKICVNENQWVKTVSEKR